MQPRPYVTNVTTGRNRTGQIAAIGVPMQVDEQLGEVKRNLRRCARKIRRVREMALGIRHEPRPDEVRYFGKDFFDKERQRKEKKKRKMEIHEEVVVSRGDIQKVNENEEFDLDRFRRAYRAATKQKKVARTIEFDISDLGSISSDGEDVDWFGVNLHKTQTNRKRVKLQIMSTSDDDSQSAGSDMISMKLKRKRGRKAIRNSEKVEQDSDDERVREEAVRCHKRRKHLTEEQNFDETLVDCEGGVSRIRRKRKERKVRTERYIDEGSVGDHKRRTLKTDKKGKIEKSRFKKRARRKDFEEEEKNECLTCHKSRYRGKEQIEKKRHSNEEEEETDESFRGHQKRKLRTQKEQFGKTGRCEKKRHSNEEEEEIVESFRGHQKRHLKSEGKREKRRRFDGDEETKSAFRDYKSRTHKKELGKFRTVDEEEGEEANSSLQGHDQRRLRNEEKDFRHHKKHRHSSEDEDSSHSHDHREKKPLINSRMHSSRNQRDSDDESIDSKTESPSPNDDTSTTSSDYESLSTSYEEEEDSEVDWDVLKISRFATPTPSETSEMASDEESSKPIASEPSQHEDPPQSPPAPNVTFEPTPPPPDPPTPVKQETEGPNSATEIAASIEKTENCDNNSPSTISSLSELSGDGFLSDTVNVSTHLTNTRSLLRLSDGTTINLSPETSSDIGIDFNANFSTTDTSEIEMRKSSINVSTNLTNYV